MKKIIMMLSLIIVLYGCGDEILPNYNSAFNLNQSCNVTSDCDSIFSGFPIACVNNHCTIVDCKEDVDCNKISLGRYSQKDYKLCINNTCISQVPKCNTLAKLEYNMTNPSCGYPYNSCICDEIIVHSPEIRIVHNASVQIIPENSSSIRRVIFTLIK